MCEKVEEELAKGKQFAEALVEHLEDMGAGKLSIPIQTDNGCYIVEVRKTL